MIYLFIFILGLLLGSFLNVLVDRIPRSENFVKGRSYCEFCKNELKWFDLIPLLSFLLLKGKCRYCHKKMSLYYPIVEFTTGALLVLTYSMSNFQFSIFNFQLIYYFFIVSASIVIFFMDLKYGIIADRIIFTAIVVSLIYSSIFSPSYLIIYLISALVTMLFFVFIALIFYILTKKIGFGGGDIKLAFLLGLILGFPNVIVAVYTAFLTGALVSIILILWRKKRFFRDSLPFGPFLILGLILSLFWGNLITQSAGKLLGF